MGFILTDSESEDGSDCTADDPLTPQDHTSPLTGDATGTGPLIGDATGMGPFQKIHQQYSTLERRLPQYVL